jgi:hypothetical protein
MRAQPPQATGSRLHPIRSETSLRRYPSRATTQESNKSHFDFVSGGITLCFCDGLLVAIAIKVSRVDNSILAVEEIQAVVCHSPSVVAHVLRVKLAPSAEDFGRCDDSCA